MQYLVSHAIVAALALAAGVAQAADYVKISGTNVDFYYDADFWSLGATVNDNSVTLRPADVYQRADVTEGAADPYQGPVFTDGVDFTRTFARSLIAVAHDGYRLNNDIASTGAATIESTGSSGFGTYDLQNVYTSGAFANGAFTSTEEIGGDVQWAYFWYEMFSSGSDSGTIPLEPGTTLAFHSAIAVDGTFHGGASVTGLGYAAAGLNSVSYSFGVSAVPEADQYAMLGAGLVLIGAMARRRANRVQA